MNVLIALAIISLFTPFHISVAGLLVRPFDAIVLVLTVYAFTQIRKMSARQDWTGLIILLPYLIWHVLSAATVTPINGIREGVQISVILMFAASNFILHRQLDLWKIGLILVVGLYLLTLYSAAYHISIGHYNGWKLLGDIKLTFTYLPVFLGILIIFGRGGSRAKWLWLLFGILVVFSGERKALIAFALLAAVIFGRGRIVQGAVMLCVAVLFAYVFSVTTTNVYLSKQFQTLLNPPTTSGLTMSQLLQGDARTGSVESFSNAQRSFALIISKQLIHEHPVAGVGTNQYHRYILDAYPGMPEQISLPIHGEFQRVLVENGGIGLFLYLMIFITSFLRVIGLLKVLSGRRRRNVALTAMAVAIGTGFSLAFEAAGTRSFVALVGISLMPDLLAYAAASWRSATPPLLSTLRVPAWRRRPGKMDRSPTYDIHGLGGQGDENAGLTAKVND